MIGLRIKCVGVMLNDTEYRNIDVVRAELLKSHQPSQKARHSDAQANALAEQGIDASCDELVFERAIKFKKHQCS